MEPKIRLKGFCEEWEEVSFGSLAKIRRGLTYVPSNITQKGIRVLRSSNIEEDTFILSDDDVFVEQSCVNIPLANDGDILITAANGSPRLVGKHAIVETKGTLVVPGGFMVLAMSNEPLFLNASMSGPWYKKFLKTGVAGGNGAIGNLNKNALEDYFFFIPKENNERTAIGNYFHNLDALIQSTTKKIKSLKQVKAASLQSMLPQEGETTPRVRFKGFEGDWEKAIIRDICSFTKGQGYSKSDLKNEGCPIILYGRMYTSYSFEMNDIDTFAKHKEGAVYSKGNEVIIPASGETAEDIAIAAAVRQKGVILGGDLNILVFNDGYDPSFMALLISYSKTHYELSKYAQGKSVVHLRNNDIANGHVTCPSMEEQKQISSFFSKLDSQITLLSQRLEKLKQIKSACLENMFV